MAIKLKNSLTFIPVALLFFTLGYANAHLGPLNEIAVKACATKEKSQMCQYEGGHNDLYLGTCQYMADELMCVRNQPIQFIEQPEGTEQTKHTHNDNKYGFN
ncbi:hypothetical protein ACPUVO_15095 [Pseudocolwellia sp. HL-MZ19]|uniref:hypothetical protein n=1 Tax=Pseudocolwellia sp. HL-MZ19 TaxID=3400846 RepID=UPI003CEA95F1